MVSIGSIPGSTENKPIRFFAEFPFQNSIELAKESFYPDISNDIYGVYALYTIDKVGEFIRVESDEEIDFDEETGYRTMEWQTKTFTFRTELENFLKREYHLSIKYLRQKYEVQLNQYKAKTFLTLTVEILLDRLRIIDNNKKFNYYLAECKRPYLALIGFIYSEFPGLTPPKTTEIYSVIQQSKYAEYISEPESLSPKVCGLFLELKDNTTDHIFPFTDFELAHKNLRHFVLEEFDLITEPINFTKNTQAARYFLHRIAEIQGFKKTSILAANIFQIAGKPLTENLFNSASSRFAQKESFLKRRIDDIINLCLK